MSYAVTKNRIAQWLGIILIIGVFAGAYWYFKVYGSTLNAPRNDLNTNGLVGLWSFNGDDISGTTAYDRSGSGNNGTLTNGPAVTQGKVGQALDFDGTNDYVSTADYSYSNAQAFTMSVWFKADTVSGNQVIFSKETYEYNLRLTDATLAFAYWDTGGVGAIDLSYSNVAANRWYLVGVTYDGSGAAYMYVDGVRVASDTNIVNTFQNKAEALRIGGGYHISGNPGYLNGQIDEMRVYNRALSAGEIQSLYAAGGGTKIDSAISQPQGTGRLDSGLAGYWPLDDGSGTSAMDSSTNGNNAGFINTPTWTTGQIGGALDFTDPLENQSLSVGDVLDMPDGANFSIAGWFYRSTFNTIDIIFAKTAGLGAGYTGYGVYIDDASDALVFLGADGTDIYTLTSSSTFTGTGWNHFVAVWNDTSANETKLYINGKLESATASGTFANVGSMSNVDPIHIGSESDIFTNNDRSFRGKLDEVRVYNRTLSADEVSQLYRLSTPTSVDTGLKGYWSFNGKDVSGTTAYDRSGAGNTGTLTGGPTIAEGKLAQGLNFDGTDDYVSVADTAAFTQSALTVSFWKKNTSVASNSSFLTKSSGSNRSWSVQTLDAGRNIQFITSSSSVSESEYGVTPNGVMAVNQWHHVVCVFNGAGSTNAERMQIYINGIAQSITFTGTIPATLVNNTQAVTIGGKGGVAGFLGFMDEVRIYNRALSAGEAKGLYDVGADDKTNSAVSQPQGTGRLDSGLAGYWPLDNGSGTSATDASTNGNTGTLTNGPTWTTGQIGSAVDFDGTDDSVNIGTDSSLVFTTVETVSAWVYMDALPGSGTTGTIFYKYSSGDSNYYYSLGIFNNAGPIKVRFSTGGGGAATDSTSSVSAGQWYHIVATFNRPTVSIYINGILDKTGTDNVASFASGSGTARIGGITSNYFNGKIDDVRVYNRALSADEVAQLYRLNAPTGTDTGLKGYWSFNGKDMSGTTAYDRSGAGNTGTLTNGPAITEGKIGQGLSFDGSSNQYVAMGTGTSLANISPMTMSVWQKVDSAGGSSQITAGKVTIGGVTCFSLTTLWGSPSGRIQFTVDYDGTNLVRVSGSGAAISNTWQHVAVTWDGSTSASNVHIYVDGTEVSSYLTTTDGTGSRVDDSATSFTVGGTVVTGGGDMKGSLDEMRMYNRVLSVAEIKSLYNSSR